MTHDASNDVQLKMAEINTHDKLMKSEFDQHIDSMSTFIGKTQFACSDFQQNALRKAEISREEFNTLFGQLKQDVSQLEHQVGGCRAGTTMHLLANCMLPSRNPITSRSMTISQHCMTR